jgi:hypothetical protein
VIVTHDKSLSLYLRRIIELKELKDASTVVEGEGEDFDAETRGHGQGRIFLSVCDHNLDFAALLALLRVKIREEVRKIPNEKYLPGGSQEEESSAVNFPLSSYPPSSRRLLSVLSRPL